ncbi:MULTISPECIES: hypothetical protein [unclassified Bradyrhizobium]|uniref:hypothetical protein n=1 Tax=unclassified Bradyrhizobium TaxID=2631580 RepID=UPI0028E90D3F|nr:MULTISPECIES: hypothetical protein [unclassified Bradyrhizobium]
MRDVTERRVNRLRLLAPLRYLSIHHPEKTTYDVIAPVGATIVVSILYLWIHPRLAIFGDAGVLRFTRDLLIMGVPFMIGALAAVAMGAPGGSQLDRRPAGADLVLDGRALTLRQFVCYLLGYLSFLGMVVLMLSIAAAILHDPVMVWVTNFPKLAGPIRTAGVVVLAFLLSCLTITIFWALYFLTDIVNRAS